MPKVSIIVPVYKVEPYLCRCIDSALAQTMDDFELILVDDGSPDNCGKICDDYAKKDSRIKVIHKENGGLSSARNAGLDVACGEYIYFFDSDDYIKRDLLQRCVKYMDIGYDMVSFGFTTENEITGESKETNFLCGIYDLKDSQKKQNFIHKILLGYKIGWEAWGRMFKRSIIEKNHIRFADNRKIFAEDLYFSLCYCANAQEIICISVAPYIYLIRENSIMGVDTKKVNLNRMHTLAKEIEKYWSSNKSNSFLLQNFPLIYYQILNIELTNYQRANKSLSPKQLRDLLKNNISDYSYFKKQIKALPKYESLMKDIFSGGIAKETLSLYRYILDGFLPGLTVRNRIIYKNFDKLNLSAPEIKRLENEYNAISEKKKRVFILGTEEFGNLGDHQINISITDFIKKHLPNVYIKEVSIPEFQKNKYLLKKHIKPDDIIILPGGGNTGDEYPKAQKSKEEISQLFPENKKIVFPQTISFSQSDSLTQAQKDAALAFSKERNVVFAAREQFSFEYAQNHFDCKTILVPDIVLFEGKQTNEKRENKVLLCLRNDVESKLKDTGVASIKKIVSEFGAKIEHFDTQLEYSISKNQRDSFLKATFKLWSTSSLVITDRLHGMVFSAITGTPCIAFANYNHKVKGVYDMISYLPYIRFANNIEEVAQYAPTLMNMTNCVYDNTPLLEYFEELKNALTDSE